MNTKKKKIITNDKRCSKKAFVKCVATELYSVFKGVWGRCPQQAVCGDMDSHKHCLPIFLG